ncbi:MAG: hypothetical protein HYZ63_02835 [Candidatus Andersenbacteria bacterium]|nr:hypothetical protein [Candidatus Andersenbacteria bacterium]
MNIYTVKGRLQTKLLTFVVAATVTAMYSWIAAESYWPLFAISLIAGLSLELLWGWIVTYQPGYLTWVFGLAEFCLITAAAILLHLPFTIGQAALYYWITWVTVQLFLIYLLPILVISWGDKGGELW